MPNYVSDSTAFEVPEPGYCIAYCQDVLNLGRVKSIWKGEERNPNKHRLFFLTEERDSHGNRMGVRRDFTSLLTQNANLTKVVAALVGNLTAEEKKLFDLDKLIGKPCQLQIINVEKDGRTYANIETVLPFPTGMKPPQVDPNYIRVQDRAGYKPPPPDPKTPAQIAKEKKAMADFISENDLPTDGAFNVKTAPMTPPPPPAADFTGATDDDIPF